MKKYLIIPIVLVAFVLSSCEELGNLVPDVDEVLKDTFQLTISENMDLGIDEESYFDITTFDQYQEYSEYIDDYIINKMTYEVLNYTATDDLYISGSVTFYGDDANDVKTLGEIALMNLSVLAQSAEEQEVSVDSAAAIELVTLLKETGTFNISFSYDLQTAEGELYQFTEEDFGTGFDLQTNLYVTMITGAGDSGFDFTLK